MYDLAARSNKLGMRPYGEDLRKRIIADKRAGKSSAEVAERFEVSQRTVERYWQRYEEKGHCRVKQLADICNLVWLGTRKSSLHGLRPSRI